MQHRIKPLLGALLLTTFALNVHAEPAPADGVPAKVRADILKRHPKAIDLVATHETHFKRHLLEVTYKDEGSEELNLELFREDGVLFTNEMLMDDLSEAPSLVKQTLEKNFPGYKLKKAELIVNPNGVGEEYEVYINTGADSYRLSINDKGEILEQQRMS